MDPTTSTAPPIADEPARSRGARLGRIAFALVAVAALAALLWPRGTRNASAGGFLVDAGGRPAPLVRELKPTTLVHFWSTWCPPCLTEIPVLIAYGRERADERFGLVLVAVADQPAKAERFLGDSPFPLRFDPNWEVAHRFGTRKLPETHLLVGNEVVESFIGETNWNDPQVRARVEKHLRAGS
jgi:thiol-disulfide isomerase/thioredoxin